MGILGLIFLFGIMITLIWKWRQQVRTVKPRPLHYLGMGIITAWGIFSCFSYPLSIPALAIILPVTLAGLNTRIIQREDTGQRVNSQTRTTAKNSVRVFYPLFISFLTGFMAYWFIYSKPIATKWIQANLYQSQKNYEPAINLYRELYPDLENEGWFLQFAGKSLSLNQQYKESAEMLERALYFSSDPAIFTTLGLDYTIYGIDEDPSKAARAEWLLSHVKYISPYKYYPRYLLAQHFYHTGQVEKAIAEAEQLLNIVPKVASPATNDMRKTMKRLVD